LLPALTPKASRTALGMVICPFAVTVAAISTSEVMR
jgi:hypothetical protein